MTAQLTPSDALQRMLEGNARFAEGRSKYGHTSDEWRQQLVEGQNPFAIVVGCADSRVPVELVFDQGFGDLFVIRNAGNVIATDVVASVQFGLGPLSVPLVVVLGHEGCGAVAATLAGLGRDEAQPQELRTVLGMIEPALADVPEDGQEEERMLAGVEANVRLGVAKLERLRAERLPEVVERSRIVGAVYEMATGRVRML